MRRPRSAGRELFIAVVSAAGAAISASAVYHERARLVHILTIFAGGFGAGATLPRALSRFRRERRAPHAAA